VRARFNVSAREPITESAYRKREEEERKEMIPVDECAMLYTEYHHAWDAADCAPDEEGDESPTDEAWYRVRDAKLAELKQLAAAGKLTCSGKGKRLKIECGSFYDWMGEPVLVVPELGFGFDVRPDARAGEVERERRDHEFIRELLDRGACNLDLPLDMESPLVVGRPTKGFGLELARVLAAALRAAVRESWGELRAIEEQVESITEEFGGEDVLHPRVRGYFDEAKATLAELHGQVQKYTGPFDLPDPDEDVRNAIQRIVDNEVKHVPTR